MKTNTFSSGCESLPGGEGHHPHVVSARHADSEGRLACLAWTWRSQRLQYFRLGIILEINKLVSSPFLARPPWFLAEGNVK